jgi:hypothetical protein
MRLCRNRRMMHLQQQSRDSPGSCSRVSIMEFLNKENLSHGSFHKTVHIAAHLNAPRLRDYRHPPAGRDKRVELPFKERIRSLEYVKFALVKKRDLLSCSPSLPLVKNETGESGWASYHLVTRLRHSKIHGNTVLIWREH